MTIQILAFGRRLQELRIARGIDEEAMASELRISRTHLRDVERERRSPLRREQIARAAAFLEVDPTSLIDASIEDRGYVELEVRDPSARSVAAKLASRWSSFTSHELKEIGEIAGRAPTKPRR